MYRTRIEIELTATPLCELGLIVPMEDVWHRIDRAFWNRARWDLKFAWLPHRCEFSRRLIWLKQAYCGTAVFTGPGMPVYEYRWATREEYLIARLKGKL